MLQTRIETQLSLHQLDIILESYRHFLRYWRNFFVYLFYVYVNGYPECSIFEKSCAVLYFWLLAYSPLKRSTNDGDHIYCHPQTGNFVLSQVYIYMYTYIYITILYICHNSIYIYIYIYIYHLHHQVFSAISPDFYRAFLIGLQDRIQYLHRAVVRNSWLVSQLWRVHLREPVELCGSFRSYFPAVTGMSSSSNKWMFCEMGTT